MAAQEPQQSAAAPPRGGGFPLGAAILIAIGVVLLLQTTGVLPWTFWGEVWRFWPVVLIILGINLLLGGRAPWLAGLLISLVLLVSLLIAFAVVGSAPAQTLVTTSLNEPLDGLTAASVRIDFGAGELRVRSLGAGAETFVQAQLETPGRAPTVVVTRAGDEGELRMEMAEGAWMPFVPGLRRGGADWDIALSRDVPLTMDVNTGASSARLDLRDLQVSALSLSTGASSIEVVMPAAGRTQATINGGAASIDIVVPAGVAARVRSSSGLASVDVDTQRFPRSGDVYESPGFATAEDRVDIVVQVGVSSVNVR